MAAAAAAAAAASTSNVYIVNQQRDTSLGSQDADRRRHQRRRAQQLHLEPGDPVHPERRELDEPDRRAQRGLGHRCDLRHLVPERPRGVPVPHRRSGRPAVQHPAGAEGDHLQRCLGHDLQHPDDLLRLGAHPDRRTRLGRLLAGARARSPTASPSTSPRSSRPTGVTSG